MDSDWSSMNLYLVANQSGWISIDVQLDLRGTRDTGGQGEKNQANKN